MSALLLSFLVTAEDALALPESCEVSSVGAGWAGVYFAFRHALNGQKFASLRAPKESVVVPTPIASKHLGSGSPWM